MLPRENPDIVIVDQMFPAALLEAKRFGRPSVAVCHTCVWRGLQTWRNMLARIVSLRAEAGFALIPADLENLWMAQDRMIVTTLGALDNAPGDLGEAHKLRHVGPVLERERHGVRVALPWPDDDARPLVLVSFEHDARAGLGQKVPDGDRGLVALACARRRHRWRQCRSEGADTGGKRRRVRHRRPRRPDAPGEPRRHAWRSRHAHSRLEEQPADGRGHRRRHADQPVNAAAVEAWGVGRALPGDAAADTIVDAMREVLATPRFREAAAGLAAQLDGVDGAANAADEIEDLLARSGSRPHTRL